MKKIIYVLILYLNFYSLSYAFIDITKQNYEQYQDIFINGKVVKQANFNHKNCELRYSIIKPVLEKFERPFTLLDIGASQGYYSFRSAYDFPHSVSVMIEGNNPVYPLIGDQLMSICQDNTLIKNVILLNKLIELDDLQRLAECEHFDVVLAMNIIHWFPKQWDKIINAIIQLGFNIIIETPPIEPTLPEEQVQVRHSITKFIEALDYKIIGQVPRHTSERLNSLIYLIKGKRDRLNRKTWIYPPNQGDTHKIFTTYQKKILTKKIDCFDNVYESSDWIPGINLLTYIMYQGIHPNRDKIVKMIWSLRDFQHNDWMINNMILQGKTLKFIDINDPNHNPGGLGGGRRFSKALFNVISNTLKIHDPQKAVSFYLKEIPLVP